MFSLVKKNLPRHNTTKRLLTQEQIEEEMQDITGSTISTLLHDRINPKDCQGFSNFLGLFQGIMANPVS